MATGSASAPSGRPVERLTVLGRHPVTLWVAFLVVHLWLCLIALIANGLPLGDVTLVYKPWALQAGTGVAIVGLTVPWVYPLLALVPIMLPLVAGAEGYQTAWLVLVILLDAVAFAVLTVRRGRRALGAGWWWLGFLALLGPVAIGRLDSITVPIAIVALLWLGTRPRVAAVLLTVAAWIKVWPAALLAAILITRADRVRMLLAAGATSLVVVVLGLTFGSPSNLFSFIGQQTGRGLQIEAPISLPFMWAAGLHRPGSFVYYDTTILTFQVTGNNVDVAIALATPLLAIAVVAVLLVGLWCTSRGVPALTALPSLSLALVGAFIAFNKVGSPQYISWFAAPVILGIVCRGRAYRTPAILVATTAALTQLIYPYLYDGLLNANIGMLAVLSMRNAMLFVVLGYAIWDLARCAADVRWDEEAGGILGEESSVAPEDRPLPPSAAVDERD